jgi:hypothetical protein
MFTAFGTQGRQVRRTKLPMVGPAAANSTSNGHLSEYRYRWNLPSTRRTSVPPVRIPLPPPAWPQSSVLCATLLAISPILAAIFDLRSGRLYAEVSSFFSKWPISLWSSGLRGFGTVLQIRVFREAYEHQRKGVLEPLSNRRDQPSSKSPDRGSIPSVPARHAPKTTDDL